MCSSTHLPRRRWLPPLAKGLGSSKSCRPKGFASNVNRSDRERSRSTTPRAWYPVSLTGGRVFVASPHGTSTWLACAPALNRSLPPAQFLLRAGSRDPAALTSDRIAGTHLPEFERPPIR